MSESWLSRAKPFVSTAFALLMLFGLMDLSPAFYGPFEFMRDNPGVAPWFSGTATMLGVFAALYNADRQLRQALERQALDDARREAEAENAERKRMAAAAQIVALVMFAAKSSRRARTDDKPLYGMSMEIQIYERLLHRLQSFPIVEIGNIKASNTWHRIENCVSVIAKTYGESVVIFEECETNEAVIENQTLITNNKYIIKYIDVLGLACNEFWDRCGVDDYERYVKPIDPVAPADT